MKTKQSLPLGHERQVKGIWDGHTLTFYLTLRMAGNKKLESLLWAESFWNCLGMKVFPGKFHAPKTGNPKTIRVSEAILPRKKKKKKGNSAFLASPKSASFQVPTQWRSHSHIFPPFLVPLNHRDLILVSYLQKENDPLKPGPKLVFR